MDIAEETLLKAKSQGRLKPFLQKMTDEELLTWWAKQKEKRGIVSRKESICRRIVPGS
ncbi:MAG: hypothetical protein K5771_07510 [Oscillospiraceae bacterium]|nr:hypothetical protein [Oscillospiraceae bacterium]